MPYFGLGLHVILALFCAVHAVRSGQPLYWLLILFSFPMLGSLVYLAVIYLPNSRLERQAFKAVSAAAKALDPEREVREARAAFDDVPTAQNQMRLAAALLDVGQAQEAAQQYQACLQGPFASDPEIRFGAGRAWVECQRGDEALKLLEALRRDKPEFRAEAVALLIARALAGSSRSDEARAAFEQAVEQFGSFQAKAEYTLWAYAVGDQATAQRLDAELDKVTSRWNSHTRTMNAQTLRHLKAARDLAVKH